MEGLEVGGGGGGEGRLAGDGVGDRVDGEGDEIVLHVVPAVAEGGEVGVPQAP